MCIVVVSCGASVTYTLSHVLYCANVGYVRVWPILKCSAVLSLLHDVRICVSHIYIINHIFSTTSYYSLIVRAVYYVPHPQTNLRHGRPLYVTV